MNDITPLITACLAGDATAWNALFKEYAAIAIHILHKRFPSLETDDRNDIIQNVFTRLAQYGLRNFQGSSNSAFLAYFNTIVKNEAKSYLASDSARLRTVSLDQGDDDSGDDNTTYEIPDHRMRPDIAVEQNELLRVVQSVLNEVPLVSRQVFLLKASGSKDREVASILGIPMGTVAQSYSRLKEKIRQALS